MRMVGAIASRQLGLVTHPQLLDAGVGGARIGRWVRRGLLHPRHRGVYAFGHRAAPRYAEELAAVLACGPGAFLSHASAAYLWGLRPRPKDGLIDVTVVGRHVRSREGIRVHRCRSLHRRDVTSINGIPVTSVARTIVDLAGQLAEERELERAVHEAVVRKQVSMSAVRAAVARYPGRRGSARLVVLVQPGGRTTATRLGAEERLFQAVRRSGLPQPMVNERIEGFEPDLYWPEARLAVELDGLDFHSTSTKIERDHFKDIKLREKRIEVLRFTGRQVTRELEMVLVAIAREYERRVGGRRAA